ncbi:SAP domain-containing protein [Salsuginibacillus kocurii]|uniref:SAP domain-containing protein n=1 Tax=Salsuginibacillus kocurii TaxID=427078 RepID=UPI000363AA92|nr:SAP domain-containing protein [Salsuginibacillus kocurii]
MKLQDVLPKMSKLYLSRTVDSFLKDVKMKSEEEMREVIVKNIEEFQYKDRVKRNLNFLEADRDTALLNEMILMALMDTEGYILNESSIFEKVIALEEQIVEESEDDDFIRSTMNEEYYTIYIETLKAAWQKDEELNSHEINILNVLRSQLGFSRRDHHLIESRAGRFPQKNNKLHNHRQIEQALKDLQLRGLILRFKTNDAYYVIPSEIARIIRYELGGELRAETYKQLLEELSKNQLKQILSSFGLLSSGTKEVLVQRVIKYNILPSKALSAFANPELEDILRGLEGVNISGTKDEKISNIIDYYENLSTSPASDPEDERSFYYDYFEELAYRNYNTLRVNKVINKDLDVEKYFEEATKYIFEKKLKLETVAMPGSKHADGKVKFNSKESVLWDNKSSEQEYVFTEEHFQQFLGYIRANDNRVNIFIIITSEISSDAVSKAHKLKAFTETDTDIALISAENLKFVAEEWEAYSNQKNPAFNMQVFNLTGELTRATLQDRMSWALS